MGGPSEVVVAEAKRVFIGLPGEVGPFASLIAMESRRVSCKIQRFYMRGPSEVVVAGAQRVFIGLPGEVGPFASLIGLASSKRLSSSRTT